MVFVVDSSGSIGIMNWELVKIFLKLFIANMDIGLEHVQVQSISSIFMETKVMPYENSI